MAIRDDEDLLDPVSPDILPSEIIARSQGTEGDTFALQQGQVIPSDIRANSQGAEGDAFALPNTEGQQAVPSDVRARSMGAEGDAFALPNDPEMDLLEPVGPGPAEPGLDLINIAINDKLTPNPLQTQENSAGAPTFNTLQSKAPEMQPMHPALLQAVIPALQAEFPSMNEIGILLDRNDRVSFSMPIMENDKIPSTMQAQIVEEIMRTGKIFPDALPDAWFEARGLPMSGPGTQGIL